MNENILVVDDDPLVGDDIRLTLEREGYTVFQAPDGYEALEVIEREPLVDLVIAGIMMPAMDGYALPNRIRQDPQTQFMPVIFLSAKGSTADVLEGWESGADYYVTKPFTSKVLRLSVQHVLGESAKRTIRL
jgi:DNA-binding response OmpR family regulator